MSLSKQQKSSDKSDVISEEMRFDKSASIAFDQSNANMG